MRPQLLLPLVLCVSSAVAEEAVLRVQSGDTLVPEPWAIKTKSGTADVHVRSVDGVRCICLISRKASFSIQRDVHIAANQATVVRWTWRSDRLPTGGDLRSNERDDQSAQLFVAFANRNVITYVWDSNAPVGTVTSSWIPFVARIKTVVVQSGKADLGKWFHRERNLRNDYESVFGEPMPPVAAVRYQINSQHTQTDAESCIAEIAFVVARGQP
jgi:hypothetical protein